MNVLEHVSKLLIRPRGVEGAHDVLGNSANTDLICQATGEPGQATVPTPTLETNKHQMRLQNMVTDHYEKLIYAVILLTTITCRLHTILRIL